MKKLYSYFLKFVRLYIDKGISGMSAQLSYYMLFSFFPTILMGSAVISMLLPANYELNVSNIIPLPIRELAFGFIDEAAEKNGEGILFTSVLLGFYSLTKYIRCYRASIRKIYGINPIFNFITEWLYSFLFSFFIFILFCLAIITVFFTDNIMSALGLGFIAESVWYTLRFFGVGIYAFLVLSIIHKAEYGSGMRFRTFLKGSGITIGVWSIISVPFSYYVGEIADYSLLYGSIGNVIMLLVWLNITNTLLLMCAGVNIMLKEKC